MILEGGALRLCVASILKINFHIFVFLAINPFVQNVLSMDPTGNIKFKLLEEQSQQSKKD